jgi:NAD(P)H-dependent flavin oxidoreductase YrpB (nitropropane dioxygenase family)
MSIQTVLTKRLGMTYPIVQAPLAGGGDTPVLVAAVCEAGGLGFIGAAYLTRVESCASYPVAWALGSRARSASAIFSSGCSRHKGEKLRPARVCAVGIKPGP